ncbi:MFS transporter [Xenorhabdus sp. NBAII XenSa04]|uniref:MFS transporter n=1 Tax=Xenorhabdus sp. NBAII XenSa04 TaxID=1429873 RepID=UPI00350F6B41
MSQFFYGSLSDSYGRKPAIVIGFFISMIGLLLSGCSEKISHLYLSRTVTAFGAASFIYIFPWYSLSSENKLLLKHITKMAS